MTRFALGRPPRPPLLVGPLLSLSTTSLQHTGPTGPTKKSLLRINKRIFNILNIYFSYIENQGGRPGPRISGIRM